MLPPRHRLTRSADFASVMRSARSSGGGVRAGTALMVIHATQPPGRAGQPVRVGLVVSKQVGGAVVRNRTKRVLRALLAARVDELPAGTDLVVRAGAPAAGVPAATLGSALDALLSRLLPRLTGHRPR